PAPQPGHAAGHRPGRGPAGPRPDPPSAQPGRVGRPRRRPAAAGPAPRTGPGRRLRAPPAGRRRAPAGRDRPRLPGVPPALRSTLAGLGERASGSSGDSIRTVILSPGPDAEVFPEHAYLARNLGYTLVSGPDLTVRHGRLTIRSVGGLEPADVVLRLVDDAW